MSSKPSTPISQRKYPGESEYTRIPVPTSPIQFRRTYSMRRLRRPSSLCETTLKHNQNHRHQNHPSFNSTTIDNINPQQQFSSSSSRRRSSSQFSNMDCKQLANELTKAEGPNGDPGGDQVDFSPCQYTKGAPNHLNGNFRRNSFSKHDRNGMTLNLNGSGHSSAQRSPRTPLTPLTPRTPQGIHYVKSTLSPKTPPVTPDRYMDDDLDSLNSYSSMASSNCEHPYFARNGTTFSGRKMKYVVHCSNYAGQTGDEYLTPTQRAQKHIRKLKELLVQARQELEQKDGELLRLTKEVVELRLFKASLSSPEECSKSSDCNSVPTVRENTTNDLHTPASEIASPMIDMVDDSFKSSPRHTSSLNRTPNHAVHHGLNQVQFMDKLCNSEMQSSFADSGHFEDITTSSMHSKDSYAATQDRGCGSEDDHIDHDRQRLVQMYEEKIEELIKQHDADLSDQKHGSNDKIEALLHKLAECNTRYCDLVPDYEQARERIRELEKQLETLQKQLDQTEDKSNKMYLHMFSKGQEGERLEHGIQNLEIAQPGTSRVSVPELMQQLQVTQDELENLRDERYEQASGSGTQALLSAKEAISLWLLGARKTMYKRLTDAQQTKNKVDPEVTLQFLKSAIYYFLTDKDNSQGHLDAIESILGFTEKEKHNIDKARAAK